MKIALVGDVMFGRLVNKALRLNPPAYPWGETLSFLKTADVRICNLECVISDVGEPWTETEKVYHFRTDEKNVAALQAANINIVSIANNHVLDYGREALQHMLKVLDENNISHSGAGSNAADASKPAIFNNIGMIAFTDNEPAWEAQENLSGVYFVPTDIQDKRAQGLIEKVKDLRTKVEFLIVSAHWGGNWGYTPPKEHTAMAHALIEAGADLIFGHSPHVFRGIEIYKDRPIIYSAGDFVDDYAVDETEKNDESFIYVLDWEPGKKAQLFLQPTKIGFFQANPAKGLISKGMMRKMKGLCADLGTHLENFDEYGLISYNAF